MIRKSLLMKLFEGHYMKRWNDKLRPVDFFEIDKQGHKMYIAYLIGKTEEAKQNIDWLKIIEGSIFDLLQRLVITDIKRPILHRIKKDEEKYKKLNEYAYDQLESIITPLGQEFCSRFREYFFSKEESVEKQVLKASDTYASLWEFRIIKRFNQDSFDISKIEKDYEERLAGLRGIYSVDTLAGSSEFKDFINLCGQLRYQDRWIRLHRIPKTSVLGHCYLVAVLSYLFSLEVDTCDKRKINNFFTGLFHDLPEVLTRDIISPLKRSVTGLEELIKSVEKEEMENLLYPLIPEKLRGEIRMFTENEFENFIQVDGKRVRVASGEIQEKYNDDSFSPRDGDFIRAADKMSAFLEASQAIENGCSSSEFQKARLLILRDYEKKRFGELNLGEIYADF